MKVLSHLKNFVLGVAVMATSFSLYGNSCFHVPEGGGIGVEVCEGKDQILFNVIGESFVLIKKKNFHNQVVQRFEKWAQSENLNPDLWKKSHIEMWLVIPEMTPWMPSLRLVFKKKGQRTIGLSFLLTDSVPKINNKDVAIFGEKTYPESFGYAAGELLLKTPENLMVSELRTCLNQLAIRKIEKVGNHGYWWTVFIHTLAESHIKDIASNHEGCFEKVNFNQYSETLSWRRLITTFEAE